VTGSLRGWSPSHEQVIEVEWSHGVVSRIEGIGPARGAPEPPDGEQVLAPGLVDLQVNGYDGHDVNAEDVSIDTVVAITEALTDVGVTTWVPTIVTAPEEFIHHALEQVSAAIASDERVGRAVPMVHVEGPFISEREGARGVHDPAHVRAIDADEVGRWVTRHPVVGLVTVSPHDDTAPKHIRRIRDLGVAVSLGHTHATTEQLRAAVDAGATQATHLGNGIAPLLPRHPNPIWTLLADDRVTAGLIADGHHLPAEVLTVMLRAKTAARSHLVSDSTALAGRPPGTYRTPVGGEVEVGADGRLFFVGTDLLAGAGRNLADGLRHILGAVAVSWVDAIQLVAGTPGRLVSHRRAGSGQITVGAPADLLLLEPTGERRGAVTTVVASGHLRSRP